MPSIDLEMQDRTLTPFAVRPTGSRSVDAAVATATEQRPTLSAHLLDAGALLFRGFDLRTPEDFSRLVDAFTGGAPRFGYAGGASPRRALSGSGDGLYSSTEYPPDMELSLHNELSYADVHPRHLFFFCLVAPEQGGATTLGDSRRILRRIDPEVLDLFQTKDVRYVRNLSPDAGSGYSWQDAFETLDPSAAEAACQRIGADWEWREGGLLHVSQLRLATARHPVTGEEVWFNQADGFHPSALDPETYATLLACHGGEDAFRLNVTWGDGTPISRDVLTEVRAAIRAERVEHRWEAGDVVVLDNYLTAHGRAPFTGPRRIALAMT
ncbi:MAG TPA: TauD/TfdA family dioxygenase [Sphingomonadaceae bacterium]|nr:TauD/TfdA family dioxygenase [Sphingomonadaceae bacterium]